MHQARAGFSCGKETAEPSTPPRIMVSGLKANAHTTDLSHSVYVALSVVKG